MQRLLASTAVLLATLAWAGGGKEESIKGDKPPAGGISASSAKADVPTTKDSSVEQTSAGVIKKADQTAEEKSWSITIGGEYHRMAYDNPNGGDKANTNLFYWYASAKWSFTKHDKLAVRFGLVEKLLADQGETGVRTDDIGFSYAHDFGELAWGIDLGASISANVPISFYSQKMGLITAPGAALDATKKFGPVTASVRAFGGYFIQRYDSMVGGAPNPRGRLGFAADVNVDIPKIDGLSVGVDAYTGYAWFYTPQAGTSVTNNTFGMYEGGYPGLTGDATYPVQPMVQSYGGELYVRYALPELYKVKSEVSLVFADGDPTLGYNSVLHDGVGYFWLYNYHTAEAYLTLSARY